MIGFVFTAARKRALRKAQQASARRAIRGAGRRAEANEILKGLPKGAKFASGNSWAGVYNKNYFDGYSKTRSVIRANNSMPTRRLRARAWVATTAPTAYLGAVAGGTLYALEQKRRKARAKSQKR